MIPCGLTTWKWHCCEVTVTSIRHIDVITLHRGHYQAVCLLVYAVLNWNWQTGHICFRRCEITEFDKRMLPLNYLEWRTYSRYPAGQTTLNHYWINVDSTLCAGWVRYDSAIDNPSLKVVFCYIWSDNFNWNKMLAIIKQSKKILRKITKERENYIKS